MMSLEITSIFESSDTAEFALMRLRERGLYPKSYHIRPFAGNRSDDNGQWTMSAVGYPFEGSHPGTGYVGSSAAAIPVLAFSAVPDRGEGMKGEVILHLLVEPHNAARVQSVLISSHGRKVSIKQ